MKKAIFFVLLLALGAMSFSQNLVVNPGFESWSKVTKPTSWNTTINCLKDSSDIKSGSYSCKQFSSTSETKNLGQKLPVLSGKNYRLSFFYKTIIVNSEHGCRIWCDWKDASGASITEADAKLVLQPPAYMKSDTWQEFSLDITSPANASFFNLEVRTYQNSIAYFDDFVFHESFPTYNREEKISEMIIYPNPVSDYLNISNLQDLKHIDIMSITGVIVWSYDFSGEESVRIPVSGFSNGLYIIRIKTSNGITLRKFIKK